MQWWRGLLAKPCPTVVTPWTVARQAPLSLGIFQARILEWVSHFLPWGIFLTQVLNPHFLYYRRSPIFQVDSLPTESPGKPQMYNNKVFFRNFNNIICLAKRYIAIKLKHDLNTSDTWFHTVFNLKKLSFISPPHVMHPHHLYSFP